MKFNKLLVKGYVGKNDKNHALWLCMCECEKYKIVTTNDLKSGHVKSCGCLNSELLIERNKNNIRKKHGKAKTRIYRIWQGMKSRCDNMNNSRYKNYGGRGITYCSQWQSFENFDKWAIENGYQENLTIDRINVDGNYEPNNCRWITNKEQQSNKQYHHLLAYNGKIQNIAKWSEETGLPYSTIWKRINEKWDIDKILKPVNKYIFSDEEDVKYITYLYNDKKYSARKIAKLYNTSHSTIMSLLERNANEQNL